MTDSNPNANVNPPPEVPRPEGTNAPKPTMSRGTVIASVIALVVGLVSGVIMAALGAR